MSRFVRNMGFYFVGTFSTKLLQLLFIPLYTKFLTTAEMGEFSVITVTVSLCLPLLFQSIWEGSFRFAIEAGDKDRDVLSTCSKYCFGSMIFYSALYLVVVLFVNINYAIYILVYGISQIIAQYWQFAARALKENKLYSITSILNTAISIVLNFILLIWFNKGVESLLIANSLGTFIMVAILEYKIQLIKDVFKFTFNKLLLLDVMKYSLPLAINSMSWWLFSSSNNYIITAFIGIEDTGIYNMAIKFGSVMTTITSVITLAWNEEAFRTFGEKNQHIQFNKVLNNLIRSLFAITLILIPFTYIAYIYIVYGEFKASVSLTPIIYLGALYNTFACHLGSVFLARKESSIMFYTTLIGGVSAILISMLLVNVIGLMGACISSLIGYVINFLIRIPMLKKRIELHIDYISLISLSFASIIIGFLCDYYKYNILYLAFIMIASSIIAVLINKKLIVNIINKIK